MCDLQEGDTVTGSGPYGSMQLRDRNKNLIFIAGGSGMAPIQVLNRRSILSMILKKKHGSSTELVRKRTCI